MAYVIQKFKDKIPTVGSSCEVVDTAETITEAYLKLEKLREKAKESKEDVTYGWCEVEQEIKVVH